MAFRLGQVYDIRAKDKTKAAYDSVVSRARNAERTLTASFGRIASAIGLAFGARGLARAIRTQLESADAMLKLQQRIGGSTEALSELEHVAAISGVRFETMTMGLQRMTRRIGEASKGGGEAAGTLRELGIDAEALARLPLEQQFEVIAQAISQIDNESRRTAAAMKIFDSEGVALLQTMTDGAEGVRRMREEARRLGVTLDQEAAESAAKARDAMQSMQSQVNALTRDIALRLAPALETAAIWWREFLFGEDDELDDQVRKVNSLAKEIIRIEEQIKPGGTRTPGNLRLMNRVRELRAELEAERAILEELYDSAGDESGDAVNPLLQQLDLATIRARALFDEFEAGIRRLPELASTEEAWGFLDQAESQIAELQERAEEGFTDVGRTLHRTLVDTTADAFLGIETNFASLLARMAARAAAMNLFKGLGSIDGPVGDFFGGFLGFQHGGSFTVGGAGGPDSQLVAFRATPGERVDVMPPGKSRGEGGVVVHQHNDLRGHNPVDMAKLDTLLAANRHATLRQMVDILRDRGYRI